MIILQTASGAGSLRLGRSLLDGGAPSTTFRNNAYIHRLNRTLQAEMRAVSAYSASRPVLEPLTEGHQRSGKELVRLIIANRGIPEDRSALSVGLTRTFIKACDLVPSRLADRVATSALRQLEKGLVGNYRRLLKVAPARDVPVLAELLVKAEKHTEELGMRGG